MPRRFFLSCVIKWVVLILEMRAMREFSDLISAPDFSRRAALSSCSIVYRILFSCKFSEMSLAQTHFAAMLCFLSASSNGSYLFWWKDWISFSSLQFLTLSLHLSCCCRCSRSDPTRLLFLITHAICFPDSWFVDFWLIFAPSSWSCKTFFACAIFSDQSFGQRGYISCTCTVLGLLWCICSRASAQNQYRQIGCGHVVPSDFKGSFILGYFGDALESWRQSKRKSNCMGKSFWKSCGPLWIRPCAGVSLFRCLLFLIWPSFESDYLGTTLLSKVKCERDHFILVLLTWLSYESKLTTFCIVGMTFFEKHFEFCL